VIVVGGSSGRVKRAEEVLVRIWRGGSWDWVPGVLNTIRSHRVLGYDRGLVPDLAGREMVVEKERGRWAH